MDRECTHDCANCGSQCEKREPESLIEKTNDMSRVRKVIGVVSGKGGVGKSLVTSLLAVMTARRGLKTAILDADITGPSIPQAFGLHERAMGSEDGILPTRTKTGISVMSLNLLLDHDTDPVVWRGPIIAGTVKQFWTDVIWGDVDYMYVDMPPGTGDVALTVFQSLPVDGIIIVTTPQQLVQMIVEKAVHMAEMMNIPVLGIVENMGEYVCPDCGRAHAIFGESRLKETAARFGIEATARLPIDPKLASACDKGLIELTEGKWLDALIDRVESTPNRA